MFELGMSIFWLLITGVITGGFIMAADEAGIFPFFFLAIFWIIGISIFIKGIKKVIANHKTEKLGEDCYGQVKSVYPNGNYVNNAPEFNADFLVYIQSKNTIEQITEKVGFNANKYPINTFVKGKYYNGDINIKEIVDYNSIPLNISANFSHLISEDTNITGDDIITVNGVRYKKID